MPQTSEKERDISGSRWHNFHFSGKVIMCSVLLGFMLLLMGGILMAIGMDSEEDDTKTENYEDVQRKPPMAFVGPVLMGIGGFAVLVGVLMCLIETNVCRKKNSDSRPLISEKGKETSVKKLYDKESHLAAIPSTSRKKSPSSRSKAFKKSSKIGSQKVAVLGSSSPHLLLNSKDTFLTPPNSFVQSTPNFQPNVDNDSTSPMKSFTSSGPSWADFQTPVASFTDDSLSFEFQPQVTTHVVEAIVHQYLTPQNSGTDREVYLDTDEKTGVVEQNTNDLVQTNEPELFTIDIQERTEQKDIKFSEMDICSNNLSAPNSKREEESVSISSENYLLATDSKREEESVPINSKNNLSATNSKREEESESINSNKNIEICSDVEELSKEKGTNLACEPNSDIEHMPL